MNLKHLTDKTLLEDTKRLAQREREITLEVLHHLREIERRRLFSELKYSSLFDYAVKELGYSDAAAIRRIKSSRLLAELPQIEKKVEAGDLNLTNLFMAANLFAKEEISDKGKKLEILKEIENTSKKECEKILTSHSSNTTPPPEIIKQSTHDIQTLKINLSNETVRLLDELKALYSNDRLNTDGLFKKIFNIALEKTKIKKLHFNAKNPALAPSPGVNRYIQSWVKKAVIERDQGKCQNCGTTRWIQYDHIIPYSMGGKSTVENLRLLCGNCNQRSAITWGIINKAE